MTCNPTRNPFTQTETAAVGVSIEGLSKSFGRFEVLKNVTFSVAPGEIFVLMGPSGSGKSVLLKHIVGLEQPSAGRVTVAGRDGSYFETDKAIINWQTFDIASGASVNYTLPNSKSFTLNRVIGDDPSKIFGSLTSNGQIYLLNPRGILFGAGSRVNAAGLVASTMAMKDEDFLASRYVFTDNGSKVAVVNEGEIIVNGGYAALLSSNVRNEGIVSSRLGTVAMAAGQKLTLDVSGDQLVSVQVEPALVSQLIENRGMIAAEDGRVIMTMSSERRLMDSAIASRVPSATTTMLLVFLRSAPWSIAA